MDRVRSSPAPLFSAATICRCRSGSSQLAVWTSTVSTVAPGATTRAVWRTSSRSRRTAGASDSSRHGERAEDVTGIRRDRGPLVRTREDARDDALVVHHHHVLCLEGVLPAGAASRDGRRLGGASQGGAPVIKWYMTVVPITGPYFDMTRLSDRHLRTSARRAPRLSRLPLGHAHGDLERATRTSHPETRGAAMTSPVYHRRKASSHRTGRSAPRAVHRTKRV